MILNIILGAVLYLLIGALLAIMVDARTSSQGRYEDLKFMVEVLFVWPIGSVVFILMALSEANNKLFGKRKGGDL